MLQNATPLRKSAPGPPNSPDEYVSCTAPAAENASLQILLSHACHRLWKCYKTLTFCSILSRCTIPRACHAKWHLNVHAVLFTFWLRNVLRATTASTFSTSQLPKVVRSWCALYILTSKCASRHTGVHFFDISTSKSGPELVCFVHFDFEMCFAPQRRALFRHHNFQKRSEYVVFLTCWLRHVLRATTACNFSSLIWPDGTRRFSEPTFRPSGATNHWKNTVFRIVSRLSYLFAHLHLLSSDSFPSLIFSLLLFSSLWLPISAFICPYCRKFDF